jgi:hypothetical protein
MTIPLCDAWFEYGTGGNRLLVATDRPGAPLELRIDLAGASFLFRHVSDIKGRRVYEASEWRPADDPNLLSRGPSSRLEGPFQRGPRDVA